MKNNYILWHYKVKFQVKFIFVFILFVCNYSFSQRPALSAFYVAEKSTIPIGFASAHLDYLIKQGNSNYELFGGLQFIGAATGKRGGYFAFGYRLEAVKHTSKKIQLGSGIGFLAGGGGAAPDKDGWMLQGSIFSQYTLNHKVNLRLGVNYTHVSGNMIRGFSPTFGIYSNFTYRKNTDEPDSELKWTAVYPELGIGLSNKLNLIFIGTGASWKYKQIAGDISIHALANWYGGYMQALLSSGYAFGKNKFKFVPSIITGLGGGGGTSVGGGTLLGIQSLFGFQGNTSSIGLKYQYVKAVSAGFGYQGLFFSIGKSLNQNNKFDLNWYPVLKGYTSSNGFGNIGVRIIAAKNEKINFMGSSYWAFTHDKGAYAEGLFEMTYQPSKKVPVYSILSIGAGAGAGINGKEESLITGLGFGLDLTWINLPISLEIEAWKGGNIPLISTSILYKPTFNITHRKATE